jgi:hypothetical protein
LASFFHIRPEQLEAMMAHRRAKFEDDAVARLKRDYPEMSSTDPFFLRTFVKAAIGQAKSYQIWDEPTLRQFLDYAFGAYLYVAGTDLVPWMDRHMNNLAIPARVRVDTMRLAMLEALEKQGLE